MLKLLSRQTVRIFLAVTVLVAGVGVEHAPLRAWEGLSDVGFEALYQSALKADLAGKVMTVDGPRDPDSLGPTLMHEHLFWDEFDGLPLDGPGNKVSPATTRRMQERGWAIPETPLARSLFNQPEIRIDMIDAMRRGGRVRFNHYNYDADLARAEIADFQNVGGRTIVDLTPRGLGRDLSRLRDFSARTGMIIVAGTGWYRWPFTSPGTKALTVNELTQILVSDIIDDGSGKIRSGIIGEIPLDSRSVRIELPVEQTMPGATVAELSNLVQTKLRSMTVEDRDVVPPAQLFDPQELRVLRASARASRLTGAALSLHVVDTSLSFLTILREEGVDLRRVIIGHAHPIIANREHLKRALDAGLVLQADYQLQSYATHAPLTDLAPILDGIAYAIKTGHRDQILLSLDLCNKLGYRRYGGGGYATLHNHLFPKLIARGVSNEDLHAILVDNPKRLLTMVGPRRLIGDQRSGN